MEIKKVATHDGSFHADDVFSMVVLKFLYPNIEIIRTRKEEVYSQADLRVDVGFRYDPETGDFDHHQKGFDVVHQSGIKKSSIGLVWEVFGLEFVDKLLGNSEINQQIADRVNWNLIQLLDAQDTGTKVCEPLYHKIQMYTISQIISNFNPGWDEDPQNFDGCFLMAMEFALPILKNEIVNSKAVISAKDGVMACINESRIKKSRIVVLPKYMPWTGLVIKNAYNELYVVFPTKDQEWRIQGIPVDFGSFQVKKPFPKSWRGKTAKDLNQLIGIDDAVFCHDAGFVAGAKTFASVMKMAEISMAS
ncbi:MAG: MYG1 family protein [Magnetococcus sp. YQC-3]